MFLAKNTFLLNFQYDLRRLCTQAIQIDKQFDGQAKFSDFGLPDHILTVLNSKFKNPTAIQAKSLPVALNGSSMVGVGKTGSGKTLAYLLPALAHINKTRNVRGLSSHNKRRSRSGVYNGPGALLLAPTRELATQIYEVCQEYTAGDIDVVCCIGGEPLATQIRDYKSLQPGLVVATPGRLAALLDRKAVKLLDVGYVVMDEADRMLDLGFETHIRLILSQVRPRSQMLMFSATWPETIHQLAEEFLGDYQTIEVGGKNRNIEQRITVVDEVNRDYEFMEIIRGLSGKKILVFTDRKTNVDRLEVLLRRECIPALGIHGDKLFQDRMKIINLFREGSCQIMVASDVAARGLDIPDVEVVINYDFPQDKQHYIHRIGRTGRVDKSGTAITLFSEQDCKYADFLLEILQETDQIIPKELHKFAEIGKLEYPPLGPIGRQKQKIREHQMGVNKFRKCKITGRWVQASSMFGRKRHELNQSGFVYD